MGRVDNVSSITQACHLLKSKVKKYLVCEIVKNPKAFIMISSRRRKAINDIIPKPRRPLPLVNQLGHSVTCKSKLVLRKCVYDQSVMNLYLGQSFSSGGLGPLRFYRVFSLTWSASKQRYWNKRKRLHKKRIQLPQE